MKRFLLIALTFGLMVGCASTEPTSEGGQDAAQTAGEGGGDLPLDAAGGDKVASGLPDDVAGATSKSLFERLGGKSFMNNFANAFVENMAHNKKIMKNAQVASRMKATDAAKMKGMIADQLCQLSGGPCQYTGRSMRETHAGMQITKDEWDAMRSMIIKTLKKMNIQENERRELAALLAGTQPDIVGQ